MAVFYTRGGLTLTFCRFGLLSFFLTDAECNIHDLAEVAVVVDFDGQSCAATAFAGFGAIATFVVLHIAVIAVGVDYKHFLKFSKILFR